MELIRVTCNDVLMTLRFTYRGDFRIISVVTPYNCGVDIEELKVRFQRQAEAYEKGMHFGEEVIPGRLR